MKRARFGGFPAGLVVLLFLPFLAFVPAAAQTPSRIAGPVNEAVRVTITHSTHPLATPARDAGAVESSTALERMVLVLAVSSGQEQELRALLDAQHTRGAPEYHHWLSSGEFGRRFGPSQDDLQQVTNWLGQHGFRIDSVARSGRWIQFSGNSGQVETAFQTRMRRFQAAGRMHLANASDISIPAALAGVVRGVASLHDFFSKPYLTPHYEVHRNAQGQLVPVAPIFTIPEDGTVYHYLAPADYVRIYDLASAYQAGASGAAQTIAIVGRSRVALTDVDVFRQIFNLPAGEPEMIVSGTDPGFTGDDDSVEASLDVEWAGAVAPNAQIELAISASTTTTDGVDLASAFIVDNNLAGAMSVSFGECESNLGAAENQFYNALWQQAAAQGISVFVSAGDNGAAGCDDPNDFNDVPAKGGLAVSGLASTPFNTAVGGTEFNEAGNDSTFWSSTNGAGFGSANGYIPEMVWNESCDPTVATSQCVDGAYNLFAGSGGASTLYTKPSWQAISIPGVPNDGKRDLPDVSLSAAGGHDGYLFCFLGSCLTTTDSNNQPVLLNAAVVGGTSASSPSFAGIQALINQQTGGRQGLANYVLYPIAAQETFANCNSSSRTNPATPTTCVFNDTTAGSNSVPGLTGFAAATGYDQATGLGSVDAGNLVNAWMHQAGGFQGSLTTLAANGSTSVQHGQPVSFTVDVKAIAGNATPTGSVSLLTSLAGTGGAGSTATVGAGALANGTFTGSFSNLPGGQYNLTAHYPGDGTFGASDSGAVAVNITRENSATTLAAYFIDPDSGMLVPASTAMYGDTLEIQSNVASASGQGFATGTVTLTDGTTQLTVLPLNSEGQTGIISSGFGAPITLAVGTHTIQAAYSGDNSLNPSSAASPLTLTITKATPLVFLNTNQYTVYVGQPVILLAELLPAGSMFPTGTIQFLDGTTPLGNPVAVASPTPGALPQAVLQISTLAAGMHTISASYSGDTTYNSTTSPTFTIEVTTPMQMSAMSTSATIAAGQTATYNLTLSANNFSGQVAFTCMGAPDGSLCAVAPNPANLTATVTSVPITVMVSNTQNARQSHAALPGLSFAFAALLGGLLCRRGTRGRKPLPAFLLAATLTLGLLAGISACGGSSSTTPINGGGGPPPPTNANLTVTGTSGAAVVSIHLTLIVTH
jgi:subtilase family serine protease